LRLEVNVRVLVVAILLFAGGTRAQATKAAVAAYPLELVSRGLSPAQMAEQQSTYRRLVLAAGVLPVSPVATAAAIRELKRQDCDVDDGCLRRFAVLANALYGLFVSVKVDVKGTAVATGRVVREDGKLVVPARTATTERKPGESLAATVEGVLTVLFKDLQLGGLPATKEAVASLERPPLAVEPAKAVEPVKPVAIAPAVDAGVPAASLNVDAGVATMPPPEASPLATVGTVVIVVGAAAAVTGAILFGLGSASSRAVGADGAIVLNGGETPEQARGAYRQALVLQPAGLAVLGAGAGVAVIGAVLLGVAPKPVSKVSLMPVPGGGGLVSVEGVFP